jgi:hypothetical protein
MTVKVYFREKLRGTREVLSADEVPAATESVMLTEQLDHCAVRFEDKDGSGAWMFVSSKDRVHSGLLDMPKKKRVQFGAE